MFGCQKKPVLPIHQIPLGYTPFKGNLGVPTGQWKFDLGGVWTHDLWIRSNPEVVGSNPIEAVLSTSGTQTYIKKKKIIIA